MRDEASMGLSREGSTIVASTASAVAMNTPRLRLLGPVIVHVSVDIHTMKDYRSLLAENLREICPGEAALPLSVRACIISYAP